MHSERSHAHACEAETPHSTAKSTSEARGGLAHRGTLLADAYWTPIERAAEGAAAAADPPAGA